jgi:hypothetical protein
MSIQKPPEAPPEVITWLITNMQAALFAFIGGIFIVVGYLGKNFWMARVIEPQEQFRKEQTEIKEELAKLREEKHEQDKEIAEIRTAQASQLALLQAIKASNDMMLELLIKDNKGKGK